MPLAEKERLQINTLVARFESDAGVQAVAAVTRKADAYPEIPWKAFALGAALGSLAAALHPTVISVRMQTGMVTLDAMLILGAGAALAAITVLAPPFGRLFLDRLRAETEARQYAQSLFLERELFRTRSRRAVLVVMCRFEGLVVVIVDTGLAQYAPPAELNAIGKAAGALLRRGGPSAAFELAFDRIKAVLRLHALERNAVENNEIDDDLVMEKGA
jgi:putative membrane protein